MVPHVHRLSTEIRKTLRTWTGTGKSFERGSVVTWQPTQELVSNKATAYVAIALGTCLYKCLISTETLTADSP